MSPARIPSNTSIGSPSGLAAVFNMIGGTAATRTAFLTRVGTVASDVARHFAAAGRVTDQRGVPEIERFDHGSKIVGVAVHVVVGQKPGSNGRDPVGRARRAVAVLREEQHLTVPGIGTERPAVRERDDRACAPVLVVDLSAIFGRDRTHDIGSFPAF